MDDPDSKFDSSFLNGDDIGHHDHGDIDHDVLADNDYSDIAVKDETDEKDFISLDDDDDAPLEIENPLYTHIEKCIQTWKKIFPWVCWSPKDNILYCLHCKELLKKVFPEKLELGNIVHISSEEQIFNIAKILRIHHVNYAHEATLYIFSNVNLLTFISLYTVSNKDIKDEDEAVAVLRDIFNYSKVTKASFVTTIQNIGSFIEETLIKSLKASPYYTIVADQCRGIIILRWVAENYQIQEHVLWSYISDSRSSPMQYLKNLGIEFDNLAIYIANVLCQNCPRCETITVIPASLPPRSPSITSFLGLLWSHNFVRPLLALLHTTYKMYKIYPHKFGNIFGDRNKKEMLNSHVEPVCLTVLMDNFEAIQSIANDIYSHRFYMEALGLATVYLNTGDQHRKILHLLQEIVEILKKAGGMTVMGNENSIALNKAFGSLKFYCQGAKFVTYAGEKVDENENANNVREFLYFVEMFIEENQKSIYYNGRDKMYAFCNIFNSSLLVNRKNDFDAGKLNNYFSHISPIYQQLKKNINVEEKLIIRSLKTFLLHLKKCKLEIRNCAQLMDLLRKNQDLASRYSGLVDFFIFCSVMPFQACPAPARGIFSSVVAMQRLCQTVWAQIDSTCASNLLYIQHEFHSLSANTIYEWWLSLLAFTIFFKFLLL